MVQLAHHGVGRGYGLLSGVRAARKAFRSLRCAGVSVCGFSRTSLVLLSTPPLSIRSTASSSVLTLPSWKYGPLRRRAAQARGLERAHQPFHVWRDRLIALGSGVSQDFASAHVRRRFVGPDADVVKLRVREEQGRVTENAPATSRRPGSLVRSRSSPPRPNPAGSSIPRCVARLNRPDEAGEGLHDPIAGRRPLVLFLEGLDVPGLPRVPWPWRRDRRPFDYATPLRSAPRVPSPGRPVEVRIKGDLHRSSAYCRVFMLPSNRGDSAKPSVQPFSGTWHVSHDIFFVLDRRVSKKSCLPSAIRPVVIALSGGTVMVRDWSPRAARSRVEPSGRQPSAPPAVRPMKRGRPRPDRRMTATTQLMRRLIDDSWDMLLAPDSDSRGSQRQAGPAQCTLQTHA